MSTSPEIIEQRKIRTAKYAAEDFYAAVRHLQNISVGHILLGSVMAVSLIFNANNLTHLIMSTSVTAVCLAMLYKMPFETREAIYTGLGVYSFLVSIELLSFGIPDPISPALAEHENWKGGQLTRLLNALSPFIYIGLRIIFVYPFFMMLSKLSAVKKQPVEYIRKAGFRFD